MGGYVSTLHAHQIKFLIFFLNLLWLAAVSWNTKFFFGGGSYRRKRVDLLVWPGLQVGGYRYVRWRTKGDSWAELEISLSNLDTCAVLQNARVKISL